MTTSRTMGRRTTRGLAAIAAAALLLTACGGDGDSESADDGGDAGSESSGDAGDDADSGSDEEFSAEATMVLPFGFLVGFAPSMLAESAGFFEDRGLDLTIETAAGSAQAIQQVLGGQALVSRTGGPDHITAVANEQAPLISIGTVSQQSPFNLISGADDPVTELDDLEGRTIGIVSAGGATEHLLDIMIDQAGLGEDEVQREVVGNDPGAFELIPDEIDAYIATSGTRSNLELAGAELEWVSTDEFAPLPGQVYVTDSRSLEENGEALDAFLGGVHEALTFMLEEDEDWEQTIEYLREWDIPGIDDEERIRAELDVQSQDWTARDGETILRHVEDHWQEAQELMASAGAIESPADPADLYTDQFVESILEGQE